VLLVSNLELMLRFQDTDAGADYQQRVLELVTEQCELEDRRASEAAPMDPVVLVLPTVAAGA